MSAKTLEKKMIALASDNKQKHKALNWSGFLIFNFFFANEIFNVK